MDSSKIISGQNREARYKYVPNKFIEVAENLESQFINHMLKQMETTIGEKKESSAENYYKDLQTTERSKIMAKDSGEGGLKDLILNQIYPEHYRNELTYNAVMKQASINSYQKIAKTKENLWAT